ncbi:hypothetical protein KQX54_006402 [Cotesia glomerata]|uniref:Carboxylesterase type B domain-containing protein n=1 Tax=Cotesia glomerata TaxID=32391 RepID=A0AAV7IQ99_COTGL|nr:hypothetical protein KQX54_006402 [Cotesia glomerata]
MQKKNIEASGPQISVPFPLHDRQLANGFVLLGIPYAEPPVGPFRFSPPRSPRPWRDIRPAQEFAPVCPQVLPNLKAEVKTRHEYLGRLLSYLKNQSEDCLYLNIYAPHQVEGKESFSLSHKSYYYY